MGSFESLYTIQHLKLIQHQNNFIDQHGYSTMQSVALYTINHDIYKLKKKFHIDFKNDTNTRWKIELARKTRQ